MPIKVSENQKFSCIFPIKLLVIFLIMAVSIWALTVKILPFITFAKDNGFGSTFLYQLVFSNPPPLKETDNRTNIALFGISGGKHDGVDLTDSISIISQSLTNNDLAIISLPRDTWSPTLKDKINSAYHYGEKKKKGGGLVLAKSITEEITGVPIHYGIVIDFEGFNKIINLLNGVDVFVDQAFTDNKFPIPGRENDDCNGDPEFSCRYRKLHFEFGWQHMDGERALEFVRSRNAEGSEGNDYAREKRQQKVLLAIKNKAMEKNLFLNPGKIQELTNTLNKFADTDLKLADFVFLAKIARNIKENEIRHINIVEGEENGEIKGFLINPPLWKYNGRWVLIPPEENFRPIHEYINCHIKNPSCILTFPEF